MNSKENRLSAPDESLSFPETESEAIEQDGWTDEEADRANEEWYAEQEARDEAQRKRIGVSIG